MTEKQARKSRKQIKSAYAAFWKSFGFCTTKKTGTLLQKSTYIRPETDTYDLKPHKNQNTAGIEGRQQNLLNS